MPKREWAEAALSLLQAGQTARVRPRGHSMSGRIGDREVVTIAPCSPANLAIGDVVLAKIRGRRYSHLVLHLILEREAERFLIGNNRGRRDGWVMAEHIFGR